MQVPCYVKFHVTLSSMLWNVIFHVKTHVTKHEFWGLLILKSQHLTLPNLTWNETWNGTSLKKYGDCWALPTKFLFKSLLTTPSKGSNPSYLLLYFLLYQIQAIKFTSNIFTRHWGETLLLSMLSLDSTEFDSNAAARLAAP